MENQDGHHATNPSQSPLWMYALRQYSKPQCESFLLHAQDTLQLNVNTLLFMGWLAVNNKVLKFKAIKLCSRHQWIQAHVIQIRALRKRIKPLGHSALYNQVKQLELDAEKMQLSAMEALMPHMLEGQDDFERNVTLSWKSYLEGVSHEFKQSPKAHEVWLQDLIKYLQPD